MALAENSALIRVPPHLRRAPVKQGPFAPDRLCCPVHHHYYGPLRLPLGRLALPGITGYRQGCFPDRRSGAEEDLSSSEDNLLAIPSPCLLYTSDAADEEDS